MQSKKKRTDTALFLGDHLVMHSYETPFMKSIASYIKKKQKKDILELGFGMGIFSTLIQDHNYDPHTILELHPEVYRDALDWAKDYPKVKIMNINLMTFPKTCKQKFDIIFYDSFPNTDILHIAVLYQALMKEDSIFIPFCVGTKHDLKQKFNSFESLFKKIKYIPYEFKPKHPPKDNEKTLPYTEYPYFVVLSKPWFLS